MTTIETSDIPPLPETYRRRPANLGDLQEVTDFYNACEIDEFGEPDYEVEEVEEEWSGLDLARDVQLVESATGEITGSMTVFPRGRGVFDVSGYVHPQHQNRGIGGYIVEWSEWRALLDFAEPSEDGSLLVRNWVAGSNPPAGQLLRDSGYRQVKRFSRMQIELSTEPATPALPHGIELLELDLDRDIESVYEVVDESFAEHWSGSLRTFESWKKYALGTGFDASLWSQAVRHGQKVGVAIGRNQSGYGWIQWVGVLKNERGKGLGSALMKHQFHQFWKLGVRSIGLGVDSENTTGALDLYLKARMRMKRNHDAFEKKLLPDGERLQRD
ncbi:GNAT family N-acetyltransferase [soil metagenome]